MITRSSKKIYIIGSNPNDFFDLTIEAVSILSNSDLIIVSKKFHFQYNKILSQSNKKVFFEEDLADSKIILPRIIHKLFEKYNSISHLIVGDSFLFFENNEELFFKKKKISVEKILGIPEVILWMNKRKLFLTNRNKNSSVSFFYPKTRVECNKILNIKGFEKLIIKVSIKSVLKNINEILLKKLDKKFKYKVFANTKEIKFNSGLKLDKSITDVYIILENAKL